MSAQGQRLTLKAYQDPAVVDGYVREHSLNPKIPRDVLRNFAQSLPGNQLLDLGCGPGHDSYTFAEMGLKVTGVDYSSEMIRRAKTLKQIDNPPLFLVGDMLRLGQVIHGRHFDGVWACASLVHVPEESIKAVLLEIDKVLVIGGKAFISVKGGDQTALVVAEDKYGPNMEREFTFWSQEFLSRAIEESGLVIERFSSSEVPNRQKDGKTFWLNYQVLKV